MYDNTPFKGWTTEEIQRWADYHKKKIEDETFEKTGVRTDTWLNLGSVKGEPKKIHDSNINN